MKKFLATLKMKIILHFLSFLNTEMAKAIEICPDWKTRTSLSWIFDVLINILIRKSKDYIYGIWVYKALGIWKGY